MEKRALLLCTSGYVSARVLSAKVSCLFHSLFGCHPVCDRGTGPVCFLRGGRRGKQLQRLIRAPDPTKNQCNASLLPICTNQQCFFHPQHGRPTTDSADSVGHCECLHWQVFLCEPNQCSWTRCVGVHRTDSGSLDSD